MPKTTDVLIIGGGPAGSSAAITLARAHIPAMLCEAGTYPRAKVCGEFYSPECTQLLNQLGLHNLMAEAHASRIDSVHLTASDGSDWRAPLPGPARGLSRHVFDNVLAQHARLQGAELCEATTVIDITGNLTDGFQVQVRTARGKTDVINARVVIAAHGKRSALDRQWNREFMDMGNSFMGLKSHFNGPSVAGSVTLHAFTGGYCGLAEIENGLTNVSLLVHEPVFHKATRQAELPPLQAFVSWMRRQNPYLDTWFAKAEPAEADWHGIGQVSFEPKQLFVDDILMAGDAAGLIAPLAGDGIAMALQSGLMAGNECVQYLNNDSSAQTLKERYATAWQSEFGKRLKLARFLQSCMLRPHLFALATVMLKAAPGLGQQFIRHTRARPTAEAVV
jgi:menaquinone-9 beta-reductase